MMYSKNEVLDYVREEDVKFIRLAFSDIFGVPKNISILADELPYAFEQGISFDASAVRGYGDECKSDLFLCPDPSTLSVLPWRPSNGKVVRMYCDIKYPDGSPFENTGRIILKRAVQKAAKSGLSCYFGPEYEFYLFKTDDCGEPTHTPLDKAGYMDIAPEDAGENVRREICLTLEEMGIRPETSHHEEGPGQNEIDFHYSDALSSADNSETFKTVVKTISAKNGLYACFDPKPLPNSSGSGMHINISPKTSSGKDVFMPFMAGILEHVSDMTLFLNSTEQSYLRLGSQKAPQYITWSPENRSQLIRIPASSLERRRIELRSPDAMANPYIAYALIILAGLDGIERGLTPPSSTDINLFTADESILSSLKTLPSSREEAVSKAASSEFIRTSLPQSVIDAYING